MASICRDGWSVEWRRALLNDPCVYCGDTAVGLDHIVPSSRGGSDHWTNRAPACRDCDQIKGNTDLLVFLLAEEFAKRTVARRQYDHVYARQAAMDMLRQRIANEFYKGNIRFRDDGRVRFGSLSQHHAKDGREDE